jgi:hypothetical protein
MPRKNKSRSRAGGPAARVRHLIALDAANVMRRLTQRNDEMVALFSRLRDRSPMVQAVDSWFVSAGFPELVLLEPGEQAVVNAFYEELAELRWYFQYTEDMPTTVLSTATARVKRLLEAHARLEGIIGAPMAEGTPAVEVEAEVVVHPPEPMPALPPAKRRIK